MEDRRDERHGLIVNGRYRTGRGLPMDIVLHDLSKSGCQIHDRLGHLEVGQFVSLRIGPIGPIEARVRWLEGRNAGIKFDSPLNDAVLDHIRTLAQPAAAQPRASAAAREPHVEKLVLSERERRFAEAVGALDTDPAGREVLAGLDREETEWLLAWRRARIHERRERATYQSDLVLAEQLEETHELRRRNKHPF